MAGQSCVERPFRQRRSGKDRRKFIDPRYRNPAYPEFRDRRKGERREPEYEHCQPLVKEHPDRKWITVIGLATAFFLICASFLTNVDVGKRLAGAKKGEMGNDLELPYALHHTF